MRMFHEEVFGPVTPVYKFATDDGGLRPTALRCRRCVRLLAGSRVGAARQEYWQKWWQPAVPVEQQSFSVAAFPPLRCRGSTAGQ